MIKVKILNPLVGRNEPTFRPLLQIKDLLLDYSIELTESDNYDFLFIGMHDFINKKIPLKNSIEYGLKNLSNYGNNYFLFDGSDSHSLMGSYEVFLKSKAIYLFKQQLHKDRQNYNVPKLFNKWFFDEGSELNLSYDIPDKVWNRIKLTNWNFLSNIREHRSFIKKNEKKSIDICAIFSNGGKENYCHGVRDDIKYKNHREKITNVINNLSKKYTILTGKKPWQEYMNCLYNSKLCISPFGMGEIRQGDGESMMVGTTICKENMSMYDFGTNVWEEYKTYIPFNYSCDNLEYVLTDFLENYKKYESIVDSFREKFLSEYDDHKLCLHWYNIFKNLPNISQY